MIMPAWCSLFFLAFPFLPFGFQPDVSSNDRGVEPCSAANNAFTAGEEVVYTIYYNLNFVWVEAGEVIFRVEETPSTYKLSATGSTFPKHDWFFKVRDRFEAEVDKETLLPIRTVRDIREGGYRLYERVEYQDGHRSARSWRGRQGGDLKLKEVPLAGCSHDVLSAIYFARNQPYESLAVGEVFPVRVLLDREEYPLRVKYLGRWPRLEVKGLGQFKAVGFSPQTVAGTVFSEGAVLKVYASDDANRLPLMIDSPVSVGSVKAVLKSYRNLRHPLSARIKA